MIGSFTFENLPCRVVFGSGTLGAAKAEIERLGGKRVLVLATPQQEAHGKALGAALGPLYAGLFAGATMHTPVEVTERAIAAMKACEADCVVALGGGATTGLGKALAFRTGVNQLCIPTTYAGSEMTPILGQTENGLKTTVRDVAVLPETVIYDVDLTMTLPVGLTATSGINAIAHAVEALYARDTNPVTSLMAEEGIRALARALPAIAAKPDDRASRSEALYGAWLCGVCLGTVGMALHHKLCHTLGGTFDLPHAETHTIVLPHALAYNAPAVPEAMARIARAIGATDASRGLFDLAKRLGAKVALRDIGMPESGIDRAADLAVTNAYWNPRPLERAAIRDLIARAWAGEPPVTTQAAA
ncbi:maleylacetate reductase [Bradyrhizobium guangdongense]|uniref:Maleylacetate reductase n=1 Tax=Bradyrhizobium guangdongense TaxID=1325090 RepID=A0A410V7K8_9BRAD|nr:maleylacetate reductase [Bradyrhizobium guangdongense]QAU39669.1 maleylacetate reductase [Bradyrhizobium guangdongense]QOZ60733.1 maleylacetate reductase [Bradyrhizobium guangdongense]GGI24323.1 maleylacetate reductase [Bradyrhizobium guangdongense]